MVDVRFSLRTVATGNKQKFVIKLEAVLVVAPGGSQVRCAVDVVSTENNVLIEHCLG